MKKADNELCHCANKWEQIELHFYCFTSLSTDRKSTTPSEGPTFFFLHLELLYRKLFSQNAGLVPEYEERALTDAC